LCSLVQEAARRIRVAFQQRQPGAMTLRGQEREGHSPADQDLVGHGDQAADRRELVRNLGAAEHHHVWTSDVPDQPLQRGRLRLDQVPGRVRKPRGHVTDAGMPAMHGPEPIADVQLGKRRELIGERAPDRVVLAGLTGAEPQVLQHEHLTRCQRRRCGPCGRPGGIGRHCHRPAQQLAEAGGDRRQRIGEVRRPGGPAQVRADHHGTAAV
jgi:hypothetical protein